MLCASCGGENPTEARFCLSCGAAFSPATSLPPTNLIGGAPVASLWARFAAVLLDSALLGAAFLAIGMWTAARWGGLTETGFAMTGMRAVLAMALVTGLGVLYYWVFEALFGATLGKGMVGITVCDAQGVRGGAKRSFIRNVLRIVDGLGAYLVGLVAALLSKRRQRIGDHLAGTYVVARGFGSFGRSLVALVWVAAIGAGIWGALAIRRTAPLATVPIAPSPSLSPAPPNAERVPTAVSVALSPQAVVVSGDLALKDFAFLESEGGSPRPPGPFKLRERVFASFKATGLTTDREGRIHVQYGVSAFDPKGLTIYKLTKELHGAPGTSNTADISVWFDVPLYIPPGTGEVRVMARDDVKKTEGTIVASFTVEAAPLAVSQELEIRDLHFSLSDGGPRLEPAVIHSGATLYVEGSLAGVQFRGDEIDVGLAFRVVDPMGDTVLEKPDFLVLHDSYAYHPPTFYIPITAHLRLPSDAPKGIYNESYVVTDRIAGASKTYELTFRME